MAKNPNRVVPPAKRGELKVSYGRVDRHHNPSVVYNYGGGGALKSHGNMLTHVFEEVKFVDGLTLVEYLREAGYDIATLKFSISQAETDSVRG